MRSPHPLLPVLVLLILFAATSLSWAMEWRIIDLGRATTEDAITYTVLNNTGSAAFSYQEYGQTPGIVLFTKGKITSIPVPFLESLTDMNDQGCIIGNLMDLQGKRTGFLYCHGRLETIGQEIDDARLVAINNRNMVIGICTLPGQDQETPFLYQDGEIRPLQALGGDQAVLMDINDSGDMVGRAELPRPALPAEGSMQVVAVQDSGTHAILFRNGRVVDLGTFGGDLSTAWQVNEHGHIAGNANDLHGQSQAFISRNGLDLEPLTPGASYSSLDDFNDRGTAIGRWLTEEDRLEVFQYRDGAAAPIPVPLGHTLTLWALNNNDVSIGTLYRIRDGVETVVVHSPETGVQPLQELISNGAGWQLYSADHIADDNSIIGLGEYQGSRHVYLLLPTSPVKMEPR